MAPGSNTNNGFLLKLAEVFMLCFIPIGLLQISQRAEKVEFEFISNGNKWMIVPAIMIAVSALIAFLWQKRGGGEKLHRVFQTLMVLYLAFWISTYGAAKVLGTQFQPPHFILETPIGDLNGFWLTWTYYGFSHTMALILGWTQITGCCLILFRRTRLLGIFILLPVMLNIDLIDHFYRISPLAYYNAFHYTVILFILLLIDYPILRAIFFSYREKMGVGWRTILFNVLKLGVIAVAFINITMLKGSFTARSRINGVWLVDSLVQHQRVVIPANSGGTAWSKLYFEWRYGCRFKYDPVVFQDKDLGGQYAIDEKAQIIRAGLSKGEDDRVDSLQMRYDFITDSVVRMRGVYQHDSLVLFLRRLK